VQFAIVAAAEGAKAAVTINHEIQEEDEQLLTREGMSSRASTL